MVNNPLNNYAVAMMDFEIARNPTATEVVVYLMKTPELLEIDDPHYGDDNDHRDLYHDFTHDIETKVKKWSYVKKEQPLHYVQFDDTEELLEDTQNQPWTVAMTLTGLPRLLRTDDQILIDGVLYTISSVQPANRKLDGIINCKVYPEHTIVTELGIECSTFNDHCISLLWSGNPTEVNYNGTWTPFKSYIPMCPLGTVIQVRDTAGAIAECTYGI